ncbi:MAG: hypothetical protein AAF384_10260, partial [Pseudomonadota bacterium]
RVFVLYYHSCPERFNFILVSSSVQGDAGKPGANGFQGATGLPVSMGEYYSCIFLLYAITSLM